MREWWWADVYRGARADEPHGRWLHERSERGLTPGLNFSGEKFSPALFHHLRYACLTFNFNARATDNVT